jgi:hypothetical protein
MLKALLAGTVIAFVITSQVALAQDAPVQDISDDPNEAPADRDRDAAARNTGARAVVASHLDCLRQIAEHYSGPVAVADDLDVF